ncbi:MAG: hypothetical protein HYV76_02180 [Candidatus Vogelbacteria bacterium]|nr:hypothetical protein [Candidatus Vogelbacteria bacterium]
MGEDSKVPETPEEQAERVIKRVEELVKSKTRPGAIRGMVSWSGLMERWSQTEKIFDLLAIIDYGFHDDLGFDHPEEEVERLLFFIELAGGGFPYPAEQEWVRQISDRAWTRLLVLLDNQRWFGEFVEYQKDPLRGIVCDRLIDLFDKRLSTARSLDERYYKMFLGLIIDLCHMAWPGLQVEIAGYLDPFPPRDWFYRKYLPVKRADLLSLALWADQEQPNMVDYYLRKGKVEILVMERLLDSVMTFAFGDPDWRTNHPTVTIEEVLAKNPGNKAGKAFLLLRHLPQSELVEP